MIFPSQVNVHRQMSTIISTLKESDAAIRPHFFLTGPSGSGKSYLTGSICKDLKVPMIEINGAQLTAEGLSGNSLSKAMRKLREHWNEPNVVFVDEFDKLFQRNGETTEGFRSNVQDEFLTMLESKYTSIFGEYGKYDQVVVENSLFIFAGAFSNQKIHDIGDLRAAGLRTEFVGRVPLVLHTDQVTVEELAQIIPQLPLFRAYVAMRKANEKKAIKAVMTKMEELNAEVNLGIRMLNSAIHMHFMGDL